MAKTETHGRSFLVFTYKKVKKSRAVSPQQKVTFLWFELSSVYLTVLIKGKSLDYVIKLLKLYD